MSSSPAWLTLRRHAAAGGAGPLAEVEDVREQLTAVAAAASLPLGAVARQLGCAYSVEADRLWLAAGTGAGVVAMFPVAEPRAGGAGCSFGAPRIVLAGGHTDVRNLLWLRLPRPLQCTPVWSYGRATACLCGQRNSFFLALESGLRCREVSLGTGERGQQGLRLRRGSASSGSSSHPPV